jgi:hypothetical protein
MRNQGYLWRHDDAPIADLARTRAAQIRSRRRARRLLVPLLLVAAAAFGLSLLLPWHHRVVYITETYVAVRGANDETWVAAGSVFSLALAGLCLFSRRRLRLATRFFSIFADGVMLACLTIDYLDWQMSAAAVNPNVAELQYLGPGFYLAFGGTTLLIVTTVLVWRRL